VLSPVMSGVVVEREQVFLHVGLDDVQQFLPLQRPRVRPLPVDVLRGVGGRRGGGERRSPSRPVRRRVVRRCFPTCKKQKHNQILCLLDSSLCT